MLKQDASKVDSYTLRSTIWRLIPLLGFGYMVSVLDRGNISFAALSMNKDLGFTATVFGWGAGIFFAGYLLFELPSNMILAQVGARRWIARIMISWGVVSALTALATGPLSFYLARFLLGLAEAGFLPGVLFYLRAWFPEAYRVRIMAGFLLFIPLTSAIGAPISVAIMRMNGIGGLHGWQWLFIIEALPSVLLGIITLWVLPDRISDAHWLSATQKTALAEVIEQESRTNAGKRIHGAAKVFLDVRCWGLGLVNLAIIICVYGISYWLPQIVRGFGIQASTIGWVVALPHLCGALGMVVWGRLCKQNGESVWNVVIPSAIGGVALLVAAHLLDAPLPAMIAFCIAGAGLYAAIPAYWGIPSTILGATSAATGLAFINSLGSVSGLVGPPLIGYIKDATRSFSGGLSVMVVFLVIGMLILLALRSKMWRGGAPAQGTGAVPRFEAEVE